MNYQPAFVQSYRQGMVETPPREFHYAGFWIRVCAQAVDILILYLFQLAVALVAGVVMSGPTIPEGVLTDLQIIEFLADIFYFCFFWTHSGATPGKMIFGLKVIDERGGPVRLGQAVKRWFCQILSGAIVGYGFMKAGWSPEKRSMTDGIARTRVIYIR